MVEFLSNLIRDNADSMVKEDSVDKKIFRNRQDIQDTTNNTTTTMMMMKDNRNYWVIHASITHPLMFIKFS